MLDSFILQSAIIALAYISDIADNDFLGCIKLLKLRDNFS